MRRVVEKLGEAGPAVVRLAVDGLDLEIEISAESAPLRGFREPAGDPAGGRAIGLGWRYRSERRDAGAKEEDSEESAGPLAEGNENGEREGQPDRFRVQAWRQDNARDECNEGKRH